MQLDEGSLPLSDPVEAWVGLEIRAVQRRDPEEGLLEVRILHDRQAPDGTVETPEDRQLKQQRKHRAKRVDLEVHVEHAHLLLQALLVVLVLLSNLVHAGRQDLDLRSGLQLTFHERVEERPDQQGVGGHRKTEGLWDAETGDGLIQALDERGLERDELGPQVVGERVALGIQKDVAVLVPLKPRVEEEGGDLFPEPRLRGGSRSLGSLCCLRWAQ
mmetsp:Transcript_73696/g.172923  ORF Transcript_73696/g.172923 Transcript_73696/m.172923 type:complete len:216 (+) Transcript_73696:937-1584(+)